MPIEETLDTSTGGSVAETGADGGVDAPADWDESLETLDTQPWWATVPEKARTTIRSRLEQAAQGDYFREIVASDDVGKKLMEENESLKQSLAAEKTRLETEVKNWQTKYDEEKKAHEGYRTQVQEQEANARYERLDAEVREKYPDIYATFDEKDPGKPSAMAELVVMLEAGVPLEKAAKMVRAGWDLTPAPAQPAAPKTRDVKVPDDVALASTPSHDATRLAKPPTKRMSLEEANREHERRKQELIALDDEEAAARG